jgi:hypothetical protein
MKGTSKDAGAPGSADGAGRAPTMPQQRVLDAYFDHPNAAAVARECGVSERHVRRICGDFADQLDERERQREADHRALADARRSKIDEWSDRGLEKTLERLDALAESANDRVALQAIKLKLEIAMHGGSGRRPMPFSTNHELDMLRRDRDVDLTRRLDALEEGESHGTGGGGR